jgi:predicted membrane protein
MKLRAEVVLGTLLVLVGFLALISTLFNVDFGLICWPTLFILLGIWIIVRPRMVSEDTNVHLIFLGDFKRSGGWEASDQEIWSFITDADLDLTNAEIHEGETSIKMYGFVGDLDVTLPSNVGFKVNAYGFVTDVNILGQKKTTFFLQPVQEASEDYALVAKKINLDMIAFVGEVKVRRA